MRGDDAGRAVGGVVERLVPADTLARGVALPPQLRMQQAVSLLGPSQAAPAPSATAARGARNNACRGCRCARCRSLRAPIACSRYRWRRLMVRRSRRGAVARVRRWLHSWAAAVLGRCLLGDWPRGFLAGARDKWAGNDSSWLGRCFLWRQGYPGDLPQRCCRRGVQEAGDSRPPSGWRRPLW